MSYESQALRMQIIEAMAGYESIVTPTAVEAIVNAQIVYDWVVNGYEDAPEAVDPDWASHDELETEQSQEQGINGREMVLEDIVAPTPAKEKPKATIEDLYQTQKVWRVVTLTIELEYGSLADVMVRLDRDLVQHGLDQNIVLGSMMDTDGVVHGHGTAGCTYHFDIIRPFVNPNVIVNFVGRTDGYVLSNKVRPATAAEVLVVAVGE